MSITKHRLETAASQLLTALEYSLEFLNANDDGEDDISARIAVAIFAIAEAKAAGIQAQAVGATEQIAERIRESGVESHEADVSGKTFEAEWLACLEYLADQADEDCPPESRTRHFIEALEDARDLIARVKAA